MTPEDEAKCEQEVLRAARRLGRTHGGPRHEERQAALEKWAKRYAAVYDARHGTKEKKP